MFVSYTVCEYKKIKDCSIKCDVYPGNSGAPVVVYIHGGALIFGGRRDMPEAAIKPFKNAGYWIISIGYRLAPETKLPRIIEDVRDALDWVREEGSKVFNYNASKMAVIGASAGGYLTLMTGTFETKPNALVSFYGYCDILGDWYGTPCPHYCREPLVSPEEAQRLIKGYEHTDVSSFDRFAIYLRSRQTGTWTGLVSGYDIESEQEKIKQYCPIHNIKDDYPPVILLHGDQDTDVPFQQSLDMYNALKLRGLTAELVTYAGGGHGFDWNKNDVNVPGLIEKALAFTKACLE